jgi:hypothetical protein
METKGLQNDLIRVWDHRNHLQQSILDNNLLEGVKRWLEPLPDKSLPALNIQHQFFQILERMTIDTISLKMSGLGKVVVFYSMCSRVEPSIKRSAEHLIGMSTLSPSHPRLVLWCADMASGFFFCTPAGWVRDLVTSSVETLVVVPRPTRCIGRMEPRCIWSTHRTLFRPRPDRQQWQEKRRHPTSRHRRLPRRPAIHSRSTLRLEPRSSLGQPQTPEPVQIASQGGQTLTKPPHNPNPQPAFLSLSLSPSAHILRPFVARSSWVFMLNLYT